MKKFFALVLVLVMALSLTTAAWGADVTTAADLQAAFTAGGDVALGADIPATSTLTVPAGKTVTLDLKGHIISGDRSSLGGSEPYAALIHVENTAKLIVMDTATNGKITYAGVAGKSGAAVWVEGALVLESGTIEVTGSWKDAGFGVDLRPNAWGTTYTEGASFVMNNGKVASSKTGVRIKDNSADNQNVPVEFVMNNGTVEASGYAVQLMLTDNANEASVKTPDLKATINDGTLNGASASFIVYTDNDSNGTFYASAEDITVSLAGGTYESDVYFYAGTTLDSENVSVSGGTYNGDYGIYNYDTTQDFPVVSGGTFTTEYGAYYAESYLADGNELVDDGTGNMIVAPATGSGAAVSFYVADATATGSWKLLNVYTGVKLENFAKGADEKCLPCYLINGEYFVEVNPAAGAYKLVYGAKTVYLNPVDSTDVVYEAKASLFTNVTKKTDQCGKLVVTDTTKVYYASYDEVNEVYTYYVADKNGSKQILVNGKIVDVELNAVQALTAHKWAGYDAANFVYTSVKCANCDKVAKLYANKTAAGKDAVYIADFGWITAADAALPGTVVAPSTDKTVTSAETFDAGIAMYVGMSVMAACGSAVVIGKKKD